MAQFEIYTHKFELGEDTYYLKPLSGKYLELLFRVMTKMSNNKGKGGEEAASNLDPEAISDLHTITLETFKRSYPDKDEEDLDLWVSQNLFKLIEHVVKVNVPEK